MSKLTVTEADKLIGQRIQQRRKEQGLTAAKLSEEIDVSQQQLSRYERGTNKINVTHLIDIATRLDTPISWFFMDFSSDVNLGISEHGHKSSEVKDDELKAQLDYLWPRLSLEQRRAFVVLLDSLTT
ncbi:helix-turn-helix domain-containing protein [Serratia fonticola]|uniref:helix-turn-helix domain-containing protein n=1 Tax=Serratia fonticola TaxID=47917 RepID=UPI001646C4BF|nr:helix-turn-helix transcriptional regulator [Serratia fonticola]MBC3227487.1 helix-turn-helix transcriptional regulator [Serratia fonticola]